MAAVLTVAGGVTRFLAEQARIDAPLGTLLASSTGQGLLRLAAGVVATAAATWFLAAGLRRPSPPEPTPTRPTLEPTPDPGHAGPGPTPTPDATAPTPARPRPRRSPTCRCLVPRWGTVPQRRGGCWELSTPQGRKG